MNLTSTNSNNENLPTIYNAIVDYHNNLVQTRFTIAGLCIAATGFLMSSWFSPIKNMVIPILGIFLALICYLLEYRTCFLLEGLVDRGFEIETKMNVSEEIAFFAYMKKQNLREDLPPKQRKIRSSFLFKKLITHSFAIRFLYSGIIIGWILVIIIWLIK